jgi:hypothetical protein
MESWLEAEDLLRVAGDGVVVADPTVALPTAPGGRVQGIAAIVRDETERWAEERALRRRVAELEREGESR